MKKVISIFLLICLAFTTFSLAAYPEDLENAEVEAINLEGVEATPIEPRSAVTETEIIYDDVYKMGDEAIVTGLIDGNVYVMGETAKIENATIYGNLYVMAQKVEIIDSDIGGSTYAMGEEITFSGMASDIYALGSKIELTDQSYVWRTVRTTGENLIVNGNIGRDLYASVKSITVGETAVIEGKLRYSSENEGTISETAQITEVQFEQEENVNIEEDTKSNVMDYVCEILSVAFKTLLVSLIIVFLVNKFNKLKRTENVATDLLISMCKGAGVLVLVPLISILLMITVIGIALGISVVAIYVILIYIATSIVALEVAYRILSKKEEIKKGAMIGISVLVSIVIWAIGLIPAVGGPIKFIIVLIGLGILFDLMFQRIKKEEVNEN